MSSKTKRILALQFEHSNWPASKIAAEVGCRPEYVRAVINRYLQRAIPRRPKEEMSPDPRVSLAALADRRRRQDALARRDLTAQLMGDPPPRG